MTKKKLFIWFIVFIIALGVEGIVLYYLDNHVSKSPYADTGKQCQGSWECEGKCVATKIAPKPVVENVQYEGRCSDHDLDSCDHWTEFEDGKLLEHPRGFCDFYLPTQPTTSDAKEAVTQPVVRSNKPAITYPANGSTVNGVTIKGTAKPNSEIWAYINYSKNELACISINSYANGGAAMVDKNGNFEFALAEPCSKELTVVASTEDSAADKTGACRSFENVSDPITFTNSGELPGICFQ